MAEDEDKEKARVEEDKRKNRSKSKKSDQIKQAKNAIHNALIENVADPDGLIIALSSIRGHFGQDIVNEVGKYLDSAESFARRVKFEQMQTLKSQQSAEPVNNKEEELPEVKFLKDFEVAEKDLEEAEKVAKSTIDRIKEICEYTQKIQEKLKKGEKVSEEEYEKAGFNLRKEQIQEIVDKAKEEVAKAKKSNKEADASLKVVEEMIENPRTDPIKRTQLKNVVKGKRDKLNNGAKRLNELNEGLQFCEQNLTVRNNTVDNDKKLSVKHEEKLKKLENKAAEGFLAKLGDALSNVAQKFKAPAKEEAAKSSPSDVNKPSTPQPQPESIASSKGENTPKTKQLSGVDKIRRDRFERYDLDVIIETENTRYKLEKTGKAQHTAQSQAISKEKQQDKKQKREK